jgi:type IV secretion system protein VirD4
LNSKGKKLIVSLLIFVMGLVGNLYFSHIVHLSLLRQKRILDIVSFKSSIDSILTNDTHRMLFLVFQGFVVLYAIYFFSANSHGYQSRVQQITPQIKTPVAAGQGQFGNARWLEKKKFKKTFDVVEIKKKDVKELMKLGEEDLNTGGRIETIAWQGFIRRGGVVLGRDDSWFVRNILRKERLYVVGNDTHTLTVGATNSGKTRTVVLETIGTLGLAGESMVMSDPKGELYQYTAPFLKRLGYKVHVIDYRNPEKSDRYNLLQPIINAVDKNDINKAIDAAWDLTATLVGEPKGERIWTDGEASVIAASILSVVWDNRFKENRKYQNLTNVYAFIAEMAKPVNDKIIPIVEYAKKLPDNHPSKMLLSISEIAPNRTRGSFYTAALTTLRLFVIPSIYGMSNASDYDPMELGEGKHALFIVLPDEKTTYYPLASLLVSQHYEQLVQAADQRGGRLFNRVNFILDEFGNFVKIADFTNKLTVGRGRGIRFNLFLQSFSQLDEKYGKEIRDTIIGNCENWIYLQTDTLDTLETLSKKLGNYTVSTYSLSAQHGKFTLPSSSHSVNLTGRPLLTVDEIKSISRPYSLVTSRADPAILYAPDLQSYYFNKMFGLGDEEHNRIVREVRDKQRPIHRQSNDSIAWWGIWNQYKVPKMNPFPEDLMSMILNDLNTNHDQEENKRL